MAREYQDYAKLDLDDWLARIDWIEQDLETLLSEQNISLAFSISPGGESSDQEFRTFPLGKPLLRNGFLAPLLLDPHRGGFWLDLSEGQSRRFILHWGPEGPSPKARMPSKKQGARLERADAAWSMWYYAPRDSEWPQGAAAAFANDMGGVHGQLLELFRLAPEEVAALMDKASVYEFNCWRTTLFYLALKRFHPSIRVLFRNLTCNSPLGQGRNGEERFEHLNSHLLLLEPDVLSATRHVLDFFRHLGEKVAQQGDQKQVDKPPVHRKKNHGGGRPPKTVEMIENQIHLWEQWQQCRRDGRRTKQQFLDDYNSQHGTSHTINDVNNAGRTFRRERLGK